MRNPMKLTLATLLAASVSTAALAQAEQATENADPAADLEAGVSTETGNDMSADAGAGAEADTYGVDGTVGGEGEMSADAGESGAEAGQDFTTYGDVVASVQNGDRSAEGAFDEVSEETSIETVLLSELQGEGAENAASLDQVLEQESSEIAIWHAEIAGNTALHDELEQQGFSASDVVAWNTDGSGEVTLVVDDRM